MRAVTTLTALVSMGLGAAAQTLPVKLTRVPIPVPERPKAAPVPTGKVLARLEPSQGCILGAYIDLDPNLSNIYVDETGKNRKTPEEFEAKLGVTHGMYFFYLGYGQRLPMDWVKRLGEQGKYVHIAFEPNGGLEEVKDDAYLQAFAESCRDSGARIFIRFASEMNGVWTKYGGNPALYREKFQLVAKVMHRTAPNAAMVWCPYTTPQNPIPSYYPGDEAVDWVGVNMYSVTYFNQDLTTPGSQVPPRQMVKFVYDRWAKDKPMMICEYAATNYSSAEDSEVVPFAMQKIRALYSDLPTLFPRVKAINYFSTNALDLEHRKNNDYTITRVSALAELYRDLVSNPYFLKSVPPPPVIVPAAEPISENLEFEDGQDISVGRQLQVVILPEWDLGRVIFTINGKVDNAVIADNQWRWQAKTPGTQTLGIEVLNSKGRTVVKQRFQITVKS